MTWTGVGIKLDIKVREMKLNRYTRTSSIREPKRNRGRHVTPVIIVLTTSLIYSVMYISRNVDNVLFYVVVPSTVIDCLKDVGR